MTHAGQAGAHARLCGCTRRGQADAVVANVQLQAITGALQPDIDPCRTAVLEHVRQRFLQQPQQVQTAARAELQTLQSLHLPVRVDVRGFKQATGAMTQRRDQRRKVGLLLRGGIDHQPQVVAHVLQQIDDVGLRRVVRCLLQTGDGAHQCAAEAIVQVAHQLQALACAAVRQRQCVLLVERVGQCRGGGLHFALQFGVEAFHPLHGLREAIGQHESHAQ